MTTVKVVETSVNVNNNSPIQDYVHPHDQTQPTFFLVIQKAIQNIVLQQIEVTSFKDFPLLDSLGFLVPACHCDVGPASVMKRVRRGRKSE